MFRLQHSCYIEFIYKSCSSDLTRGAGVYVGVLASRKAEAWMLPERGVSGLNCSQTSEGCRPSNLIALQIFISYRRFFFSPFKKNQLWNAMQDHLEPTDKCCCATATPSQVTTSNCSNLLTFCIAQKQASVSFVLVHSSTCHI